MTLSLFDVAHLALFRFSPHQRGYCQRYGRNGGNTQQMQVCCMFALPLLWVRLVCVPFGRQLPHRLQKHGTRLVYMGCILFVGRRVRLLACSEPKWPCLVQLAQGRSQQSALLSDCT